MHHEDSLHHSPIVHEEVHSGRKSLTHHVPVVTHHYSPHHSTYVAPVHHTYVPAPVHHVEPVHHVDVVSHVEPVDHEPVHIEPEQVVHHSPVVVRQSPVVTHTPVVHAPVVHHDFKPYVPYKSTYVMPPLTKVHHVEPVHVPEPVHVEEVVHKEVVQVT